jgi:hypothetical protein
MRRDSLAGVAHAPRLEEMPLDDHLDIGCFTRCDEDASGRPGDLRHEAAKSLAEPSRLGMGRHGHDDLAHLAERERGLRDQGGGYAHWHDRRAGDG